MASDTSRWLLTVLTRLRFPVAWFQWLRLRPHSRGACEPTDSRSLDDPAGVALPVTVPENALVQFAGRQAGQSRLEIDRTRHLLAGKMPGAECHQFIRDCGSRIDIGHQFDRCLDLLTQI